MTRLGFHQKRDWKKVLKKVSFVATAAGTGAPFSARFHSVQDSVPWDSSPERCSHFHKLESDCS